MSQLCIHTDGLTDAALNAANTERTPMTCLTTDCVIEQSGVIPYRFTRGRLEVALVTTSSGDRWVVPKGHIEAGLDPRTSALKEAYEEAGLIGVASQDHIGSFHYIKRGRLRRVWLYPMAVRFELSRWPEAHRRLRIWREIDVACELVWDGALTACLSRLPDVVTALELPAECA